MKTMRSLVVLIGIGILLSSTILAEVPEGSKGRTADAGPRDAKERIGFHPASSIPVDGFAPLASENNETVFVAPDAAFGGGDVLSAMPDSAASGATLLVRLTSNALAELNKSKTDRVAVLVQGRLVAAPLLEMVGDVLVLDLARLSSESVQRITKLLSASSATGTTVTLVPRESTVRPGELVSVDVFLTGVFDLRAYQIGVEIKTEQSAAPVVEDIAVETERTDFVFSGQAVVHAADPNQVRLTSALYSGGKTLDRRAYAGTFTYRMPMNATGTHLVQLRTGNRTLLRDSCGNSIDYQQGAPARIGVGLLSPLGPADNNSAAPNGR